MTNNDILRSVRYMLDLSDIKVAEIAKLAEADLDIDETLPPRPPERRVSNNLALKKLRVAFELKDIDMHAVFSEAGFPLSKPELSALFRQPGHKHYRACGDQILRNFLKGLTARFRVAD